MKILHVLNTLEIGGAEARVVSLLNFLNDNHEVSLVCLNAQGGMIRRLNSSIELYDLRMKSKYSYFLPLAKLIRIIKTSNPDIIHTHLVQASLLARLAAIISRTSARIVTTQHNAWHPKQKTWIYRLERRSWNRSEEMIALSLAISRYLEDRGYRRRITVVYTGVSTPERMKRTTTTDPRALYSDYFLTVGHFRDKQKGHDILLQAYSLLQPQIRSRVHLLLAGDGPRRSTEERRTERFGIAETTHFVGERDDISTLMSGCLAFVLASRWEGFGRVLVEAMSAGCAIVATRVEAVPELIENEKTGLLVAPEAPVELAWALEEITSKPELRKNLKVQSIAKYRKSFSIEDMVEKVEVIYNRISDRVN